MPGSLSKYCIDISCKEYVHPWTDSCVNSTAGLGLHAIQECLRIYSTVYIITLLMKGKVPSKHDIKRTILGILQSTAFLSWSGFSYSLFLCFLRRILGNFNILTVSMIPSFLSSLSAIIIERPSRRVLLALYVTNIASETLFKMGVWRGYFSVIPRGEVYIFAASMAVILYFFRLKKDKQDSIYKVVRFIIGDYEESEYFYKQSEHFKSDTSTKAVHNKNDGRSPSSTFNIVWKTFEVYKQIIGRLKAQSKHASCPHPHSCIHYVLTGGVKMFSCGCAGQLVLKLFFKISTALKKSTSSKRTIFMKEDLNPAIFLGGFAALYRLISCSLRRIFHKDSEKYAIPAGLIASMAFSAYPNNTIALYCMWKALQFLWNDAVDKGIVPEVKWFVIFLYCFSTSILFHVAILEPQNLRPSYWKFLYNLSGGRIAVMTRHCLDKFGLHSSKSLQEVLKNTHTTDLLTYSF